MKILPVAHHSLAETVAGKIAASILDGSLKPGMQLPPERDMITRLEISRATLREALKALMENDLIESRPGVGWFARSIDESNVTQAHELARGAAIPTGRPAQNEPI
jgi:GntR family transcriptional repressor for pyruvate dehydrogenase complex